ncbi:MAG: hypothetical protein P4L84_32050 [Isosphaeraceae bacterium]|nr:hypothetical protein [Isosphaeraceae bacterium]
MGAEPWFYCVPYQEDIEAALEALKQREFAAGNYRMIDPDDPPATIEEAVEQMDADGTGTVLDMIGVADRPHEIDGESPNFCMVAPLAPEQLIALFGTEKPTREMIEGGDAGFWESIDRGLGIYIIAYDGDNPSELFFAGYSFD